MLKSMRLRPITRDCRRADTRSAARKPRRETQGLQSGSSGMPLWGQTTARDPTMKAKDDDLEMIQGPETSSSTSATGRREQAAQGTNGGRHYQHAERARPQREGGR